MAAEDETEDGPKLKPPVPGNKGKPPEGGLITEPGIIGGPNTLPWAGWIGNGWEVASPLLVTRSHKSKGLSSTHMSKQMFREIASRHRLRERTNDTQSNNTTTAGGSHSTDPRQRTVESLPTLGPNTRDYTPLAINPCLSQAEYGSG